jgi:Mn2+/Fe2+ NRAMP family transporter
MSLRTEWLASPNWGYCWIQYPARQPHHHGPGLHSHERIDVITGSVLTGVIGLFVVITCAVTLHAHGLRVDSAADAAAALAPLAGPFARSLFAVGIIGAAILATAVLPLSTAHSLCDSSATRVLWTTDSVVHRSSTAPTWGSPGWP